MPKKTDQIIEPLDADFDAVAKAVMGPKSSQQAAKKTNKNNDLAVINPLQQAAQKQIPLDLGIEVQKDIGGIEMGVLDNGMPYLTQRGLSVVTGAARSLIQTITKEWEDHFKDAVIGKDRIAFFKQYLFSKGFNEPTLHVETVQNGTIHYAYPDVVCMAFLEYYAFESKGENSVALDSFRKFATFGLGKFIYEALDYTPGDKWKYYHDRVSILKDSAPIGYFTIFQETTGLAVDLINADLVVNSHTMSDGSVGSHWATYWKANNLATQFGDRIPYHHNFPNYYPQALSNPQLANAYPDEALPLFRKWFKQIYLLTKFPAYMLTKANMLPGGKAEAIKIGGMYHPPALPSPKGKP